MGITRRYKDLVIRYSSDFNFDILLRHRIYKTEDGTIETPITPMLLARQVESDCKPPKRTFNERHVIACFANPDTKTGESNLKAIIPYLPNTVEHKTHIQEIKAYTNVLAIEYYSEGASIHVNQNI